MFSKLTSAIKHRNTDSGSALAVVVITVVFVALWFGSVSVLTNSGQSILKNAITSSTNNSNLVNTMIQNVVLKSLTPDQMTSVGTMGGDCGTQTYTDPATGDVISVQCVAAPYSGNTYGNSLSLVGTGSSTGTNTVGLDGGIAFTGGSSSGSCTTTQQGMYVVFGGLLNTSGAFSGAACNTLEMNMSTTAMTSDSTQTLPAANQIGTAQIYVPTTSTTTWTGGTVGCPTQTSYTNAAGTYSTLNSPCTYAPSTTLSPTSSTTAVGKYMNSVEANLPTVTGAATWTSKSGVASETAGSWNNCKSVTSTYAGVPAVVWSPGVIGDTLLADLNAMTNSTGCGKSSVAIVFTPGTYVYAPTTATEWYIDGGAKVILGTPHYTPATASFGNIDDCDATKAGGQFQYTGPMFMQVASGALYLCPDNATSGSPTLVAVSKDVTTTSGGTVKAWNPNNVDNPNSASKYNGSRKWLMTVANGNNGSSACSVCFISEGMVYTPAGSTYVNISGNSQTTFGRGAFFKGMTINMGSSARKVISAKPPATYFNGDRKVQLKFFNTTTKKSLGVVQLTIKDGFGQALGSGYKINTWAVK